MRARVRRWQPQGAAVAGARGRAVAWLLLGACLLLMTSTGCRKKTSETVGLGLPDTSSSRDPAPAIARRCDLAELITEPALDSPEWVVQDLLTAAYVDRDLDKALARFSSHFASERPEWIEEAYWPKARKRVDDLVHEDHEDGDKVMFTVCRRDTSSGGTVKLYLMSYAKTGSNPPVSLTRGANGVWKVSAFAL